MPGFQLQVLFEDNHLLAVNKPAGLPTMGAAEDRPSLIKVARQYIKERYQKPGNVYLGVVSRLDSLATGVVIFARTSKAAARLNRQFAAHETAKLYWAIVEREPVPAAGDCVDWLWHDDARQRVIVTAPQTPQAKEARLAYRTFYQGSHGTLIEVQLETGRKHQIRVQLAHHGWPILGDAKYGSRRPFPKGIALHARQLEITHPVRQDRIVLQAPLPAYWKAFAGGMEG
jgi:23S rRNA pseudouridine1911/1915/1917 synthase